MSDINVIDLTVDELRGLIREVIIETFADMFADPDAGFELRDEFQIELQRSLAYRKAGTQETEAVEDVVRELGLEW